MSTSVPEDALPGTGRQDRGRAWLRPWLAIVAACLAGTAAILVTAHVAGMQGLDLMVLGTAVLPASGAIGAVLALPRRRPDHGLRSGDEVVARLHLPALARIPRLAPAQDPLRLARDTAPSSYRTALELVADGLDRGGPGQDPPQVLLVTSTLPGEGKTTLSLSLAALAAASGKVLVLDLDLRQPNVHRRLGHAATAGLVEHVIGGHALPAVIRHDPATGIDFLPVGLGAADPDELLAGERLPGLLAACRAAYDWIVIDSAPVGLITDTRLAARLADRVVFVVEWGRTPARAVAGGLQALRSAGVEPAGIVLTQAPPMSAAA